MKQLGVLTLLLGFFSVLAADDSNQAWAASTESRIGNAQAATSNGSAMVVSTVCWASSSRPFHHRHNAESPLSRTTATDAQQRSGAFLVKWPSIWMHSVGSDY
jgi:hypothetical protein